MKRNRRAGVEDRWQKSHGDRAARYGIGMRWRARYVDDDGREHTKASRDGSMRSDGSTGSLHNSSRDRTLHPTLAG
jgi:hypothetical protein